MAVDRGEIFLWSPILLYMWLLERFRFVFATRILVGVMHSPAHFFRRPLLLNGDRDRDGWN